jgi:hypothetical protein
MLGITPLVMKEVAANLVRERIPVTVSIGGIWIKPELGSISIRFLQVPTV